MNRRETGTAFSRENIYRIIFLADTPAGKAFDIALLAIIVLSVLVVVLESVAEYRLSFGHFFIISEWVFTGLFTIEYFFRLYSARSRKGYVTSFYGVVDLLSVLPTYLALFAVGWQYLLVIRSLRLLRVARIFKLSKFVMEGEVLHQAVLGSVHKIAVFILAVITLVIIIGSTMYMVEGPEHGFNNIPQSIYWAIVTLTTVGYGDISPQTEFGQFLASIVMLMGYGIIAVPTGIVTVEMGHAQRRMQQDLSSACTVCGKTGHEPEARYCSRCSARLTPSP
ncbi:MAG: ion transporter [Sphingobacteriales bacterium]|nr:MAG: ion transporter [Sphingobacteriales bacterium]